MAIASTDVDVIRQAKIDLAASFRAAALHGFNEGIDNHFSLAVPGRDDLFLLNRYGPHWSELRASDILTIDLDGNAVHGPEPDPCRRRRRHPHRGAVGGAVEHPSAEPVRGGEAPARPREPGLRR